MVHYKTIAIAVVTWARGHISAHIEYARVLNTEHQADAYAFRGIKKTKSCFAQLKLPSHYSGSMH